MEQSLAEIQEKENSLPSNSEFALQNANFRRILSEIEEQLRLGFFPLAIFKTKRLFNNLDRKSLGGRKLLCVCWVIKEISRQMALFQLEGDFLKEESFLNEIIDAADFVKPEKNLSQEVAKAWVCSYVASCNIEMRRYDVAVELYHKAINNLVTSFGEKASRHKIYVLSLNNMGMAFQYLMKLDQAKNMFEKSVEANKHVEDWKDEKEKNYCYTNALLNMKRVMKQMFYCS